MRIAASADARPTQDPPPQGEPATVSEAAEKAEAESVPRARPTEEVIVCCIDVSGSMQAPFFCVGDDDPRTKTRTRLEAVKQMFYGFRDQVARVDAGTGRFGLGLISFASDVTVHAEPSANYAVFEDVIDDLAPAGTTALFDAVCRGCDLLAAAMARNADAELRVIVLSDGQSNHGSGADAAAARLREVGGTCDAFVVGDGADAGLLRLVAASGGESFRVGSIADAYETLESEGVVSLEARRNGAPRLSLGERQARIPATLGAVTAAKVKKGTLVSAAPPPPPVAVTAVVPLADFVPGFQSRAEHRCASRKRLARELRHLGQPAGWEVYAAAGGGGDELVELRLLLRPEAAHYAEGTFELRMQFPASYPFTAPTVRFVTPIYHYAVGTGGNLCLPILQEKWGPATTICKVLGEVAALVNDPAAVDPTADLSLRSWLSELLRTEPEQYAALAAAETRSSASVTAAEIVASW